MYKVMIVDDIEVLRRDVKRLKLWGENSGFVITEEAKDGQEALKKLEGNSIDLVITDIRMPNMDGIELLRNISEQKLCPFTVLLSDYTEYSYARQGFLHGAFDYIGKPIDESVLGELLARIRQHLLEMQEEARKHRELEELAEDVLLIEEDIKQVIVHIRNRSPNAGILASNLIDIIFDSYGYDKSKLHHIVKNAMHKLIGETRQTHKWLDMFIDIDSLTAIDYSSFDNPEEIKAETKGILEQFLLVIRKMMGSHNSEIVKHTCEYVLTHVNEEISVKLLSESLYINKSYLSEIFKQKFGMTLLQYITMAKMERAKKLLQEGKFKNYQIAEMLGFKDHEYFGRLFKKYIGVLPRDCRN